MDNKTKKKKILQCIGLVGLFLLIFGLSYALFTVTLNGTKKVKIKTGKLELQLLDANNNPIYITDQNTTTSYEINLNNQVPVSDEEGLQTHAFEFKLKNTGNIPAKYTIYLDDVELEVGEERLADEYIRYSLTKNGSSDIAEDLTTIGSNPNRVLNKGLIEVNTTYTYTLKIWIDENADNDAMDKVFNATLRVEGSQYISPFENNAPMADQLYAKDNVGTLTAPIQNGFSSTIEEMSGLYKYTDTDNTITYVYRGLPEDNYVTFAEQTWRILRIQSDGSIKLIREDALDYVNTDYGAEISDSKYGFRYVQYNKTRTSEEDNRYSTSNIKSYVEAWYSDMLETDYDNKIKNNTYCSDRYEPEEPSSLNFLSWTHLYGYRKRGEYKGNRYQWSPSVSCTSGEEIISKVGLITADEYILGGGAGYYLSSKAPYNNYLKKPYYYWTMSPAGFRDDYARSYYVGDYGSIHDYDVSNDHGVRPVITLKADATISSGNGTSLNPYVIE